MFISLFVFEENMVRVQASDALIGLIDRASAVDGVQSALKLMECTCDVIPGLHTCTELQILETFLGSLKSIILRIIVPSFATQSSVSSAISEWMDLLSHCLFSARWHSMLYYNDTTPDKILYQKVQASVRELAKSAVYPFLLNETHGQPGESTKAGITKLFNQAKQAAELIQGKKCCEDENIEKLMRSYASVNITWNALVGILSKGSTHYIQDLDSAGKGPKEIVNTLLAYISSSHTQTELKLLAYWIVLLNQLLLSCSDYLDVDFVCTDIIDWALQDTCVLTNFDNPDSSILRKKYGKLVIEALNKCKDPDRYVSVILPPFPLQSTQCGLASELLTAIDKAEPRIHSVLVEIALEMIRRLHELQWTDISIHESITDGLVAICNHSWECADTREASTLLLAHLIEAAVWPNPYVASVVASVLFRMNQSEDLTVQLYTALSDILNRAAAAEALAQNSHDERRAQQIAEQVSWLLAVVISRADTHLLKFYHQKCMQAGLSTDVCALAGMAYSVMVFSLQQPHVSSTHLLKGLEKELSRASTLMTVPTNDSLTKYVYWLLRCLENCSFDTLETLETEELTHSIVTAVINLLGREGMEQSRLPGLGFLNHLNYMSASTWPFHEHQLKSLLPILVDSLRIESVAPLAVGLGSAYRTMTEPLPKPLFEHVFTTQNPATHHSGLLAYVKYVRACDSKCALNVLPSACLSEGQLQTQLKALVKQYIFSIPSEKTSDVSVHTHLKDRGNEPFIFPEVHSDELVELIHKARALEKIWMERGTVSDLKMKALKECTLQLEQLK